MTSYKTLDSLPSQDSPIFLRADLNVPLKNGGVLDGTRILKLIPTLLHLLTKTNHIVLATHLGRPETLSEMKEDHPLSTSILKSILEEHLNQPVYFVNSCTQYEALIREPGVYLLQNLRFYEGEEENSPAFAKDLLGPCKHYVNDAFSCSHRAHASVAAITQFAPSYAGLLMEEELHKLIPLIDNPKRPLMAIVGGSKISTKIKLLQNLLEKVDYLVVGGAMANTFLKAQNQDIGSSLYEEEYIAYCHDLLTHHRNKIILPIDFRVGKSLKDNSPQLKCKGDIIDGMILDFGTKSVQCVFDVLSTCQSVIWNGPLGAYEYIPYDESSIGLAHYIASLTQNNNLYSVAGGGDTIAVLQQAKVMNSLNFVSTAGGAFLELLEGKTLPGVEALKI